MEKLMHIRDTPFIGFYFLVQHAMVNAKYLFLIIICHYYCGEIPCGRSHIYNTCFKKTYRITKHYQSAIMRY